MHILPGSEHSQGVQLELSRFIEVKSRKGTPVVFNVDSDALNVARDMWRHHMSHAKEIH